MMKAILIVLYIRNLPFEADKFSSTFEDDSGNGTPDPTISKRVNIIAQSASEWIFAAPVFNNSYKPYEICLLTENMMFHLSKSSMRKDCNTCNYKKRFLNYRVKSEHKLSRTIYGPPN